MSRTFCAIDAYSLAIQHPNSLFEDMGWAVGIAGGSTGGALPWTDAGGQAEGTGESCHHAERSDPTMLERRER